VSNPGFFHQFVEARRRTGVLICQPRMGFSPFAKMRRGLEAVRACPGATLGTITLDSYTRVGDLERARRALDRGEELNGYPIVAYPPQKNRELVAGLLGPDFPIQVRHGTALPQDIVRATIAAGLEATEGGPISYCFPYSRTPLAASIAAWAEACRMLAALARDGTTAHLESFGGCMLGQLCPPALLVAIAVIEGLFFLAHGLASISVSYAQNTNFDQDVGAVLALRDLAGEFLGEASWHVVVYSFMGKFPETPRGARLLIEDSARLAALTASERLIVKTAAEAHQIPTIDDNVEAIGWAQRAAAAARGGEISPKARWHRQQTYDQARFLMEMVLSLDRSFPKAIEIAFGRGFLDLTYCLHPDNSNRSRSWIADEGAIQWSDPGGIPLPRHLYDSGPQRHKPLGSSEFAMMLSFNQRKYDAVSTAPTGDPE
jgi:methylaspartate mutase epsilon subunit